MYFDIIKISEERLKIQKGRFEQVLGSSFFRLDSDSSKLKKVLGTLGIPETFIGTVAHVANTIEIDQRHRIEITKSYNDIPVVRYRRFDSREIESSSDCLETVLSLYVKQHYRIEWNREEISSLCVLDVDIPNEIIVPRLLLEDAARNLHIQPIAWKVSTNGNGLHLVYKGIQYIPADAFAAAAAFFLQRVFPYANFEINNHCRVNHAWNLNAQQCYDLSILKDSLVHLTYNQDDFNKYLIDRFGTCEVNARAKHDTCPVNPKSITSDNGKTPAILIKKNGVKCFYCESHGIKYGSKSPGWFPARVLVRGNPTPSELLVMATNFVEYHQAELTMVDDDNLSCNLYKPFYKALLYAIHESDDSRIEWCLRDNCKKLYRTSGVWVDEQFNAIDTTKGSASELVRSLPSVYSIKQDFSLEINKQKLAWFQTGSDIATYGYFPVQPVQGFLFTQFDTMSVPKRRTHIWPNYLNEKPDLRPRYIDQSARAKQEIYDKVLLDIIPGLNLNALKTILIGRGCSEYAHGPLPMTNIKGPSQSGKSLTAQFASAIIGEGIVKINQTSEVNRFYDAIYHGSNKAKNIFLDEFWKGYSDHKFQNVVNQLLLIDENMTFHLLFAKSIPLGKRIHIILADTELPDSIAKDMQMARRLVYVPIDGTIDIKQHFANRGISNIDNVRAYLSQYERDCIDSMLSDIVDKHFKEFCIYEHAAKCYGFDLLSNSNRFILNRSKLRDFFKLLLKLKPVTGIDKKKFGENARVIKYNDNASELWNLFIELQTIEDRKISETSCRAITETNVGSLIPNHNYTFEIQRIGNSLVFTTSSNKE